MSQEYRQLYLNLLGRTAAAGSTASNPGDPVVRAATLQDLPGIVTIHQKAFHHFFLTQMGAAFLRRYYQHVLQYRSGIVLVSEREGRLNGFVCGFADPANFYRSMWRSRRVFALPALTALLRHPSLAANVLNGVRRIYSPAVHGPERSCELSSIAVAPEASGNGLGKMLLRAFLEESWSRQADCVYLTTDADGNQAANALYRETGFQQARRFLQRKDRWMNEYVFHRVAAGQLEMNP